MDDFLVLRQHPASRSGRVLAAHEGPERLSAEVYTLDDRSAAELGGERESALLVRAMPLTLIAPRGVAAGSAGEGSSGESTTWGVRTVAADRSEFDGRGVTVAVLDTGIDARHPCFGGIELVTRNFTDGDSQDTDGHGTHCAGTLFGRAVDGMRIGVAPGITRALIGKVIGKGCSTATLKHAIDWAAAGGARVISMSLGLDFPGYVATLVERRDWPVDYATSVALADYRATIRFFDRFSELLCTDERAPLIVAAAGNESRRPRYPMDVAPPAAANHVLSVAAVGQTSAGIVVADFSNAYARLAAPGVEVRSAAAGGSLVTMSGTSMAAPHVAGVAALWAQYLGEFTHEELRSRVHGTARRFSLSGRDVGAGVVQAPTDANS